MRTTNDGGPAFPLIDCNKETCTHENCKGMTLRDWFAGMALQGWIAGPCCGDKLDDYDGDDKAFGEHQYEVAKSAYGYADAMIRAREGKA